MKTTILKITALATVLLAISCGGKGTKKKTEEKAAPVAVETLEIEKPN